MTTIVIIFIAAVLVAAVVAYAVRSARKRRIRSAFGPEYVRVVAETGGTRAADRELARRTRRHEQLRLEPLSADDQEYYSTSWAHIRGGFLDDPTVAVSAAEQLTARLLADRGYPADDQPELLALLSVHHGHGLEGYCRALWVGERLRADPESVSTEVKREALMQYQTFFGELLAVPGATSPSKTKGTEVTV